MSKPERVKPVEMNPAAAKLIADGRESADGDAPTGLRRLFDVLAQPIAVRSLAVTGLLFLALFYTLYFARGLLVPIAAAVVLQLILAPLLRMLVRLHVPGPVGAAVLVLGLVGGGVYGGSYLVEPVATWLDRTPTVPLEIRDKLDALKAPVEQVADASKQVEAMTKVGEDADEVVVREESLSAQLFAGLGDAAAQLIVAVVLLYFLLASGDLFKLKLVRVLPRLQDKKRAVTILRQIEHDVSTYLFTVTLINAALGCAVGGALWAIGLPNAALWGVMAAVLNFIPFLGSVVGVAVIAVIAFLSFDELSYALLPPAAYLALTTLEGNFITPAILGRRLLINPVFVLLNIIVWGWLWGVPGALLAGPLLVIIKVLCDHVEPFAPVGEFLGDRDG